MFTEYIATQGDRWDSIAYKAYGDASQMNPIIEANPSISLSTSFVGGERLLIPIIEVKNETDKSLLPPWKRVPSDLEKQAAVTAPLLLDIKTTGGLGSFDQSFD